VPVCRNSGTCRNCLANRCVKNWLKIPNRLGKIFEKTLGSSVFTSLKTSVFGLPRAVKTTWSQVEVTPQCDGHTEVIMTSKIRFTRLAELTRGNIQMQSIAQTQCVWYRGVTGDEGGDSDCDSDGHVVPLTGCDHSSSAESLSADEPTAPSDAYRYQRRRSRAVLYQLSGTYRNKRSTASKLQLRKVCTRDSLILTR